MKSAPSTAPVVEKARQDPHCPWFLTGVTAPLVLQSTESVRLVESRRTSALFSFPALYPLSLAFSSAVQVERWLCPTARESFLRAWWLWCFSQRCLRPARVAPLQRNCMLE